MKYKERRGNVFVFDGGYDSKELELSGPHGLLAPYYNYKSICIRPDLNIFSEYVNPYKDIQTAVSLMTILKDEGLV